VDSSKRHCYRRVRYLVQKSIVPKIVLFYKILSQGEVVMVRATRENHREDIAGRANVEETPELLAYYDQLEALEAGALWTVANKIEPWQPKSTSVPVLWRYKDLRGHVLRSVDLVTPEKAGRRVVYLNNPGRRDVSAAVGWLYSGLQVMNPGEVASAHAHSASALRFIMEGAGAYTIVDGHKLTLGVNDFVLTPNGTWHEHGVDASGSPSIWQDGLDIPLVNALEANFYTVHPEGSQAVGYPIDDMRNAWGNPGLRPSAGQWSKGYSPLFKYEWAPTYEALSRYATATDGSPFDGVLMNYVNPVTGGPVMPTIGAAMQMLRPGERTRSHRHTGSAVYQVAKGSGFSIIDGKRFDWNERDIFCVPSWAWHEHGNSSRSEDACLFSFNDLPVMWSLGLYREEAYGDNDGQQPL
jgi:gentisate 1,2-dioxygenase